MARKRKHRRGSTRCRRRNPGLVIPNPRRRRRSRGHRANPRRHRRRRNPFGSAKGMVGSVMQGFGDALAIVGGKVASRAIPALVGLQQTGIAGVAIQAGSAIAASWAANKVKPGLGRLVLAGGLAGILEGYIKGANIPVVSAALGDYYDASYGMWLPAPSAPAQLGGVDGMGAWNDGGAGEDISDSVGILPG